MVTSRLWMIPRGTVVYGVRLLYLLDVRDTEDDEHPSVVVFVAGTLIGIADIRKEIIRNLKFIFQQVAGLHRLDMLLVSSS